MKITINFLTAVAIFLLASTTTFAQRGGGDPTEKAKKQTTQMVEKLSLNDEQATQVEAINVAYAEQMKAAREEVGKDREAMKSIMDNMNNNKNTELKAVLTSEQFQQYETMQAQGKEGRGGKKRKGFKKS